MQRTIEQLRTEVEKKDLQIESLMEACKQLSEKNEDLHSKLSCLERRMDDFVQEKANRDRTGPTVETIVEDAHQVAGSRDNASRDPIRADSNGHMVYTKKTRNYRDVVANMAAELNEKIQKVQFTASRNRPVRTNSEMERIREENMIQQRREKKARRKVSIEDVAGLQGKLKSEGVEERSREPGQRNRLLNQGPKTKVAAFYVGLGSRRYAAMRRALEEEVKLPKRAILGMSWVGRQKLELLVEESYGENLKKIMKKCNITIQSRDEDTGGDIVKLVGRYRRLLRQMEGTMNVAAREWYREEARMVMMEVEERGKEGRLNLDRVREGEGIYNGGYRERASNEESLEEMSYDREMCLTNPLLDEEGEYRMSEDKEMMGELQTAGARDNEQ